MSITTSGNFSTIDITHKPKRMQGENFSRDEQTASASVNKPVEFSSRSLESAILFFLQNAKDKPLYMQTAVWLRELLLTRSSKTKSAVEDDGTDQQAAKELLNKIK